MNMTRLKFFVLAGMLGTAIVAGAQTNTPSGTNAVPHIAFAATDYDFGKVDSGVVVKHEYIFTNTGSATLEVSSVHPSCGCTTAGEYDKQVAPGQTGKIPVQFNSGGYGGAVHKTIAVTCNDPAQPSVTLNLQGTIWKAFDVTPAYAVFNIQPEGQGNQTQVVKIVNNDDQPAAVSDPTCGNPAFQLDFKTVQEGKVYELSVTAIASNITGTVSAPITLKTTSAKMPQIVMTAFAMMQPLLTVTPAQVMLPAGPLANPSQFSLQISNNGTNAVTLSDPEVNATGMEAKLTERLPGRQFDLTISFPAGFQGQSGTHATVKCNNPKYPVITVPVYQPALPATNSAANPATHGGSAAEAPASSMKLAEMLKK